MIDYMTVLSNYSYWHHTDSLQCRLVYRGDSDDNSTWRPRLFL